MKPLIYLRHWYLSHTRVPQQSEKSSQNNVYGSHCAAFLASDVRTACGLTIRQPRYRREQNESESQEHAFKAGKGDEVER